jgi:uncharacterized membrane protein YdjX (TVP38/TMEM64 family)
MRADRIALPWRGILRSVLLLVGLAALGFAWAEMPRHLSPAALAPLIAAGGGAAPFLFVALAGLAMAVGLPRQVGAFAAGYLYGPWLGTLIGLAASLVSAAVDFGWARFLGRAAIKRRLSGRLERVDAFLAANPFGASLMLRLLPVGNNVLLNVAAGVSGVSPGWFLVGSAIGYLPQTIVFALLGGGTRFDRRLELALAVGLFLASALIGLALYRRAGGLSAASADDRRGASARFGWSRRSRPGPNAASPPAPGARTPGSGAAPETPGQDRSPAK